MISLCDKSVVIIDPAINNADNYKPYQDGIGQDIFIKVCEDSYSLWYFCHVKICLCDKNLQLGDGGGRNLWLLQRESAD